MSDEQVVDRQWRELIQASCSGTWEEYSSASDRLASVDRLGMIKQDQLQAVKIIAQVRDGVTEEAVRNCRELLLENPELVLSFVIPKLREAPERKSDDFVKFTESFIKTIKRKAGSVIKASGSKGYIRSHHWNAWFKPTQVKWLPISIVLGVIVISLSIWYRYERVSPTSFFDNFSKAIATNDPSLLWEQLPHSLQFQADALIHEFGNKMPTANYDASWDLFRRIVVLLDSKRKFIMNSTLVKVGLNVEEKQQLEMSFDLIVPPLRSISSSEITTVEGLRRFNTAAFLRKNGTLLMEAIVEIMRISDRNQTDFVLKMLQPPFFQAVVTEQHGNTATVRITGLNPDISLFLGQLEEYDVQMMKLEGKWIPVIVVAGFHEMLSLARVELDSADFEITKDQTIGLAVVTQIVGSLLTPLEDANTQREFDQALGQLLKEITGTMLPFGNRWILE